MTAELSNHPISVVIVVFHGKEGLNHCLDALVHQADVERVEIIIPYDDRIQIDSALKQLYPDANFIYSGGYHTYGELRTLGIQYSHAGIVAITEDHCIPNSDWCAQILNKHQAGHPVVGGVVEKQIPDTPLNWALYFADYLRYMKPLAEGAVEALTDLNVSYKRTALQKISTTWASEFHENVVHEALRSTGLVLWLSPDVIVSQKRSMTLTAALKDRIAFGRLFASTRIIGTLPSKRAMLTISSLILPLLLLARITMQILAKRRWFGAFLSALPALVLICSAWGWGEFLGYLTGAPPSSLTAKHITEVRA